MVNAIIKNITNTATSRDVSVNAFNCFIGPRRKPVPIREVIVPSEYNIPKAENKIFIFISSCSLNSELSKNGK